ncbi:MAG: cytochrome ubiquinol oxidase subunit I [Acidimicrobiales bacterium]
MSASLVAGVSAVSLARWQFAVTTVFHFLFVPLSIGLAFLVAVLQTAAYRTKDERYDKLARWWGHLFLVNFAIGVVTGIVLEFQFGMAWSQYSTFVGNIFGAPLAIEGLLAFFMESTFLGVWIFGRDRVSARVHLACIWLVSLGTLLSAAFILAANAWMQHPVGFKIDPVTHQAVMTNFWAVLSNSTFVGEYLHVVFAALLTASMFMLGISAWHMRKDKERSLHVLSARIAIVVAVISVLGTIWMGDSQAKLMTKQQPMKMAAAEALYNSQEGASFSLITIGDLTGQPVFQIRLPHLLSVLATDSWNGKVEGVNQAQAAEVAKYGAGDYKPVLWITYWSFRIMVGLGFLMLGVAFYGLWLMRRRRLDRAPRYLRIAMWSIAAPFIANTTGWIFTEMGRQPWVVYGLLTTAKAVSHVSAVTVGISLIGFTAVYTILAVVEIGLIVRLARTSILDDEPPVPDELGGDHGGGSSQPHADALVY